MLELLQEYWPILWQGLKDTLYMSGLSTLLAYLLGLPMGVLLHITGKGGIAENRPFNSAFGWCINILRSIPFLILMLCLTNFTRLVVGKAYGASAAVVPLVIGAAPFVARLVESSLAEVDVGVVEAARCMGATNWQIIHKVLLTESVPSLVRGIAVTTITLVGYSAMAGACGAGGLGDIAIRYGLHRFVPDVMYLTLIFIILIVCFIQLSFDLLAKRVDKRYK